MFTDIHTSYFGNKRCVAMHFCSIVNRKCTPSDRQMYPRLGTSALDASKKEVNTAVSLLT